MNPVYMQSFLLFLTFYMGACIGSFLNVVIDRLPCSISFMKGRSYCPECDHTLSVSDLFPVFSFLLLKGRCRYCGAKINPRCFLVETLFGLATFLSFYKYDFTLFAAMQVVFWSMLLVVGMIDFDTMYIYDAMLLFYLIIFIVYTLIFDKISLLSNVKGAVVSVLLYALIYFLSKIIYKREAFGVGDVLLNGVLGFYLGVDNIFFICFLPFYIAIFDLILRRLIIGELSFKSEISFGPFMCISAWLISLYGDNLRMLFRL